MQARSRESNSAVSWQGVEGGSAPLPRGLGAEILYLVFPSSAFEHNGICAICRRTSISREPRKSLCLLCVIDCIFISYFLNTSLSLQLCLSPSLPLDVICPKLRDHLRLYHAWTFSLARHCLQSSHTSSPLSLPSTPLQCPALPSPSKSIKGALLLQQKGKKL